MDDAQNQQINQLNPPQATSVIPSAGEQGVQSVQQLSQARPAQPIGGPHKEMAPLPQPAEYLKPAAETHIELSKELVELGAEQAPDQERPVLSPQVQQAGVAHAKEVIPVPPHPSGTVQLLETPREELLLKSKTGPVTEAAKWFALFLLRQVDKVAYQKAVTHS